MGNRKRDRGIQLSFGKTTCTKCKGERLLARNCADCGARPKDHEMQFDLQRRERIVAEFRRRREAVRPGSSVGFETLGADCDRATDAVLSALAAASREARSADELVKSFRKLDQLALDWNVQQPRPSRNRGRVVGQSLSLFVEGLEQFVEALVAPDTRMAQRLERRGNELFKEAERVQELFGVLDRAEELISGTDMIGVFNGIGIEARATTGLELSLIELDANLASGTGWEVASSGMGIQAHILQIAALSSFDIEHFTAILSSSDKATSCHGSILSESDGWRRAHARAGAFLSSALASLHHVIESTSSNEFEVVHRAVESVSTWRDGVLKHALATMMSQSVDEYEGLVSKNAGAAIKRAAIELPQLRLNESLSPEIRNAGAHAGFDLTEGGVRIGDTWFSSKEFLDKVLAYLETTVAAFAGVTLAMTRNGADLNYSEYLTPRDRDSAVALMLGMFGLELESSAIDGGSVELRASGHPTDWMALAAALSSLFPDSVSRLDFSVSTPSGDQVFETSLAVIREQSKGLTTLSTKQTALRLASMISVSSLNGESLWSPEFWTKIANQVIGRADEDNLIHWVKNVRELRASARRANEEPVVETCTNALAKLRPRSSNSAANFLPANLDRLRCGQ